MKSVMDKIILFLGIVILILVFMLGAGMTVGRGNQKQKSKATVSNSKKTEKKTEKTTAEKVTTESEESEVTTEAVSTEMDEDEIIDDTDDSNESEKYVLPDSSTREYSASELESLTDYDLKIARNEIYMRHNYKFNEGEEMDQYFNNKFGYTGDNASDESVSSEFSKIEKHNVNLIREEEAKRKGDN